MTLPTNWVDGNIVSAADYNTLNAQVNKAMPAGGIILWSGAANAIPSGWALCNGTNGTPDLRGRFIVGAGGTYAVGNMGGADNVTLTQSQLPSYDIWIGVDPYNLGPAGEGTVQGSANDPHSSVRAQSNGGGQAHENRPPYYALCYIMRLAV